MKVTLINRGAPEETFEAESEDQVFDKIEKYLLRVAGDEYTNKVLDWIRDLNRTTDTFEIECGHDDMDTWVVEQ